MLARRYEMASNNFPVLARLKSLLFDYSIPAKLHIVPVAVPVCKSRPGTALYYTPRSIGATSHVLNIMFPAQTTSMYRQRALLADHRGLLVLALAGSAVHPGQVVRQAWKIIGYAAGSPICLINCIHSTGFAGSGVESYSWRSLGDRLSYASMMEDDRTGCPPEQLVVMRATGRLGGPLAYLLV